MRVPRMEETAVALESILHRFETGTLCGKQNYYRPGRVTTKLMLSGCRFACNLLHRQLSESGAPRASAIGLQGAR